MAAALTNKGVVNTGGESDLLCRCKDILIGIENKLVLHLSTNDEAGFSSLGLSFTPGVYSPTSA